MKLCKVLSPAEVFTCYKNQCDVIFKVFHCFVLSEAAITRQVVKLEKFTLYRL